MPFYEFHCEACEHSFDHMTSMQNRDAKPQCPKCGSKKTARKLSVVSAGASSAGPSPAGHMHSGACGCGRPHGSCGMN